MRALWFYKSDRRGRGLQALVEKKWSRDVKAILKKWVGRYFSDEEALILLAIMLGVSLLFVMLGSVLVPILTGIVLAYADSSIFIEKGPE